MNTLFLVLHIIVTVALIFVVLIQEGKDAGMKALAGSAAGGDSFFSKNSGRTKAALFSKLTTIVTIIFVILVVVLFVIQPEYDPSTLVPETNGDQVVEDAIENTGDAAVENTEGTDNAENAEVQEENQTPEAAE